MEAVKHLGAFLAEQLQERRMSVLAFSEFVGVSHATINKFLDFGEKDTGYPSVDFLIKLAKATGHDVRYILSLVVPSETLITNEVTPDVLDMSQRISRLPEQYRKIIAFILDTATATSAP
jgi:transcriptional regulator with XRE-family HTH domain